MDNQNQQLGSPTFQSLPAPKMNPAPAQVKKRRCNEVVSKSSNSKTEPCASPCNELSIILYLKLICFHTTSKIDFTWLLEKVSYSFRTPSTISATAPKFGENWSLRLKPASSRYDPIFQTTLKYVSFRPPRRQPQGIYPKPSSHPKYRFSNHASNRVVKCARPSRLLHERMFFKRFYLPNSSSRSKHFCIIFTASWIRPEVIVPVARTESAGARRGQGPYPWRF
mmetsp:Transcript_11713/g.24689  ORF Transcript_11713/g.24689 Transcript_11713/m.24689 type:complete len:224 (-) Transcript_11713:1165-1836(-)